MNRIEMFIGTEKDKHGATLTADRKYHALEATRRLLAHNYGGFTEIPTVGGWRNEEGNVVMEAGLKYEIFTDNIPAFTSIGGFAGFVRDQWNQSAVLLVRNGRAEFI